MALQIPPNVAGDTLIGLPKSADSQRWDIVAKVPSTGEGAPDVVGGRPLRRRSAWDWRCCTAYCSNSSS